MGGHPPADRHRCARPGNGDEHAVYAADKHRPVEIGAAQREYLTRWVSSRLNRSVAAPELSTRGYKLVGGRLVASPHGAAALFVYEDASGKRLILYIRPMSAGETTLIEPIDVGDMDGYAWIERAFAIP